MNGTIPADHHKRWIDAEIDLRVRRPAKHVAHEKGEHPLAKSTFPDRRLITIGLLAGAAVGAWAGNRARELADRETQPGLINWDQARSIAVSMNRQTALTEGERARLDDYYRGLVAQAVPLVAEYTGDQLPARDLEHVYAFDRVDWINANIESFREMFEPLEALNPLKDQPRTRVFNVLWGNLNQTVLSGEIGLLLGYLARRVLGQYDLALLGREPLTTGKLYFVQPNIRGVENHLRLPEDDFRLWLALHESTHAFEFEAHPWLRQHMNSFLQSYFALLNQDIEHLKRGVEGIRMIWERARDRDGKAGSWIELVMTREQRDLFNQMQATMSIIEGYSNHVMNAVGKQLIPTYDVISRRFEQRQRERTPAEQLFARLTGLNVKLEQYKQGEAFIDYVVQARGHDFAKQVWIGPEYLPTMEELRAPDQWIQRVEKP